MNPKTLETNSAFLDQFACFILCNGRPNSVPTYDTLRKSGYTGRIYIICDDLDKTLDEYKRIFGEEWVCVFDKQYWRTKVDPMDTKGKLNSAVYARNACFQIAKDLGLQYFCELDDDYDSFRFRFESNDQLSSHPILNLDAVFEESVKFLSTSDDIHSVAFAQGGDYIGGLAAPVFNPGLRRKCMNSWICDVDKPFTFHGTMNDDVNAYTAWGSRGKVFFTLGMLMINQPPTQLVAGGSTDLYTSDGTYQKSFYSVMQCPSFVYISMMGDGYYRIHHLIDWPHAVPKIISSVYQRKRRNEMKFTIKTAVLQDMVAKAVRGASNNKLIPITELMAIKLVDGDLTLITTDATNYLYIKELSVEGEDFEVVVPADIFSKLIARMTCDSITLKLLDNCLQIIGNGTYSIELPLDEEGQAIKYPDPLAAIPTNSLYLSREVNRSTVQVMLNTLKSALATTTEVPCYTGYYVGDSVVATDTYKIANYGIKLFDAPHLISSDMMDLWSLISADKFTVDIYDNTVVASSQDCIVYGTFMDGVNDFAIDAISGLVNMEFSSMCKVSKTAIMQVLDRLALFVGPYDKNGIYLTFTGNNLQISSKSSSGVEVIDYRESKNSTDFTCCIDIEMLASQIKAQEVDLVEIWYGEDNAIKMIDGNITQVVALLEDDRIG